MSQKITIVDNLSGQTLFVCDSDSPELAYQEAKLYEEIGIDFKINIPSVTHTLLAKLGASNIELAKLSDEINQEIESHFLERKFQIYHMPIRPLSIQSTL